MFSINFSILIIIQYIVIRIYMILIELYFSIVFYCNLNVYVKLCVLRFMPSCRDRPASTYRLTNITII